MKYEVKRLRPWYYLTRDFWKYLDLLIAELNAGFCKPKVEKKSSICFLIILVLVYIPFALLALPIVVICRICFLMNHNRIVMDELKPKVSFQGKLTVFTNNTCLMPEGLARINNLPFVLERAEKIGSFLSTDYFSDSKDYLVTELPSNIDVICLQEVFNEEAWTVLNEKLAQAGFNYFVFDAQEHFIKSKTFHFVALLSSGLYIASKYKIKKSEYTAYKNAYLEDGLSAKGLLLVEIELTPTKSAIVGNTHLQAPTSGDRVKSSVQRLKQWDTIQNSIVEFKKDIESEIVLETVMGDFNTDFLNSYDQSCKDTEFYKCFKNAHVKPETEVGTCLVEENVRDPQITTPEGLKQALLEQNSTFIWSSDSIDENGQAQPTTNGKSKFDHIFYSGAEMTCAQIHTKLAGLTDHLPLSATFKV